MCIVILLAFAPSFVLAQVPVDTVKTDTSDTFLYPWEMEEEEKDSAGKLVFYQIGVGGSLGNTQYFEGFNHALLYNNATSGLPIYSDWGVYSNNILIPRYRSLNIYLSHMDTVRNLKTRLGAFFYEREDSMLYVSAFAVNDTIFGRQAREKAGFGGISGSAMITTKQLFRFLRLYGGASLEIGFSPGSKIHFVEYALDYGDQRIIDYNEFFSKGKPRIDFYGSAILGLETCFAGRVGFSLEARSGAGLHLIVNEPAIGISKIVVFGGLNYYFQPLRD
jgi:hypothetical protein